MSGKGIDLTEPSWVLRFPTDILAMLLTQWMSLVDISHLDLCISHLLIRKKFLDIISAGSTVYNPPVSRSIGDIRYYNWLYDRNISIRSIRTTYHMDEKLPLYLQEKVCRHIKRLDFSSGASHSYLDLPSVLSFCPQLEELLICENTHTNVVDEEAFEMIVQYCKHLRLFELRNNHTICTTTMLQLVTGCKKLAELHFQYCYGVCDDCLKYIATHCTFLTKLTVRTNEAITNTGVTYVVQHCMHLTDLVVPACLRITNTGIVEMMVYCSKLQHLDLSVLAVKDDALLSIAINCTNLHSLVLKSCCFVTNTGVVPVIEKCTALVLLDVKYCHNLVNIKCIGVNINPLVHILTAEDDAVVQCL